MRFAISLFVLIAVLGISAKKQTPIKTKVFVSVKSEPLVKKELLKPSEELLRALKEVDYKSRSCYKDINNILKSKKDSLSLIANRE